MRTAEEYQDLSAKFRALATATSQPILKKRYLDLAVCYRLLAEDRKRLIAEGVIEPDAT